MAILKMDVSFLLIQEGEYLNNIHYMSENNMES
jgi:hypothetical protein